MAVSTSAASMHSAGSDTVDVPAAPPSLGRALLARRSEYVQPRKIRLKIGTWNVAACPGTDKDLESWFIDGKGIDRDLAALDLSHNPAVERSGSSSGAGTSNSVRLVGGADIDLYVLGLQEVVDLNMTKEYMNRAMYADTGPIDKWKAALEVAMPPGYELIMAEQMTGLLQLIYASPEIAPTISNVSTQQVGTGLLGYFGNKGAVSTRLVLGETTRITFVNCHLASGAASNYLERRCWDVRQILAKTQFDPIVHSGVSEDEGDNIGDEEFAFWFGDLNFRLDGLPGDDIRRLLTLHARGEYGLSDKPSLPLDGEGIIVMRASESDDDNTTIPSLHSREQSFDSESSLPDPDDFPEDPSQDPESLQATLDSLLPHDQLKRMMTQRKVFHDGWKEGRISFLPTYKYDVGTIGLFDSSEKQRAPSWCDRILYRTRQDKREFDHRTQEEDAAKKKDEEMKLRGLEEEEDVLFSYDPEDDADEQPIGSPGLDYDEYDDNDDREPGNGSTKDSSGDRLTLDIYGSHQRITSSDHKPVTSVFTLEYDAVVPELKAKIHAEVARELDRAENEGRPSITIIAEGGQSSGDNAIDFGEIGFLEKHSLSLTIANTSGVPATFEFLDALHTDEGDQPGSAYWLKTTFVQVEGDDNRGPLGNSVTLEPGDTISALVEAKVFQVSHCRSLNDSRSKLEDVLVLRVEDGRDHFLPVRATWLQCCFGRSIDELIRVPEGGIRKFVQEKGIKGAITYDCDVHCSAPRELFKLTDAIQTMAERCAADEAMVEELSLPSDPGWPLDDATWTAKEQAHEHIKAAVISALDKDDAIAETLPVELTSPQKLEILTSVLLLFLASLTDGLVPPLLWAKLSTNLPSLSGLPTSAWPDVKTQVLDVLSSSPSHNIAFVFLTATLARVINEVSPAVPEPQMSGLRRRLSFQRGEDDVPKRRRARERRYAELLGPAVFRAGERDKGTKDRERALLEMFLRREEES